MARPHKIGLDYFDVPIKFNTTIETIELLHGNNGLIWVLKFWQVAYSNNFGEVMLDGLFGELHANKCRITIDEHLKILDTALKIGFCYKTENAYTSNEILKKISSVSHERAEGIIRNEERKKKEEEERKKVAKKERIKNSKEEYSIVKETIGYSPNNPRITPEYPKAKTWRDSFEIYKSELKLEYDKLINNIEWINDNKHLYPGIDIKLSIEKAYKNFWSQEAGWKNKKSKKIIKPDYRSTLINAININPVKLPYNNQNSNNNQPYREERAAHKILPPLPEYDQEI